jgi:phospholipid-transporting ATPase
MILINSRFVEGICYVETSSLDGEKTLKLKVANKYTQGFISSDFNKHKRVIKSVKPQKYSFSGYIKINSPNIDLNYVNGTMHTSFKKNGKVIEEDINISTNEFILKGSALKNTNYIIGIVVYTGMNNKIILNSKKPRLKMSKVEKQLNIFLLFVFIFLFVCCIICSIVHKFDYENHKKFYDNFIFISNSPNTESFIIFFTYFLLLNTMIPISLIVSTEIIKMIQGIFITWDVLLYSKWRKSFCSAKSVSIIEELGNVNFIFSDKTGTLTKNQLQFKYCIINKNFYRYVKHGNKLNNSNNNNNNNNNNNILNRSNIKCIDKKEIHENSFLNIFDNPFKRKSENNNNFQYMNRISRKSENNNNFQYKNRKSRKSENNNNFLQLNSKKMLSNFNEIRSINYL